LFHEIIRVGDRIPESNQISYNIDKYYENKSSSFWEMKPLANSRLPWNKDVIESSFYIWSQIRKGKDWTTWIPDSPNKTLNVEFLIFREKLMLYQKFLMKSNLPEIIPSLRMIKGILTEGPFYAKREKKNFDYSIRVLISLSNVNYPDDVTIYPIEGIDHLFPSRHFIPYEHVRDISDAKFSLKKPLFNKPDYKKLEVKLFENLKEKINLRFFDDLDALKQCDSKKGIDVKSNNKDFNSTLRFKKGIPNRVASDEHYYEISFTTKGADESRVIAIPDIETRNMNTIVREMTTKINNCKSDAYGKPRWDFEKWLSKKPKTFFIMVDQSKCGWTFPTELIALYFKVASQKYPEYTYFNDCYQIFDQKKIFLSFDGVFEQIQSGFVLGMWDNIASFVISCIFELFLEKEGFEFDSDFEGVKIEGRFWGDDQIIRLENASIDQTYNIWNKWIRLMLKHGINVNQKKKFRI